jgi:hypothetical protein
MGPSCAVTAAQAVVPPLGLWVGGQAEIEIEIE